MLKIGRLRSAGVQTTHRTVASVNSVFRFGSACLCASFSYIKKCRAASHNCVTRQPNGRSAAMDLNMVRGSARGLDPTYHFTTEPISQLASALWDAWIPIRITLRCWSSAFD